MAGMDHVMDPAKGLWDQPGWKRYIPPGSVGADGQSRESITDLVSLHADTGYLVQLKPGSGDVKLQVSGRPVVRQRRWVQGSYNLAGFPIHPDAAQAPMAGAFFASSPITEARRLSSAGTWGI